MTHSAEKLFIPDDQDTAGPLQEYAEWRAQQDTGAAMREQPKPTAEDEAFGHMDMLQQARSGEVKPGGQ